MIRAACRLCTALRPLDELVTVEPRRPGTPFYLCKPSRTRTDCFTRTERAEGVRRVRAARIDLETTDE